MHTARGLTVQPIIPDMALPTVLEVAMAPMEPMAGVMASDMEAHMGAAMGNTMADTEVGMGVTTDQAVMDDLWEHRTSSV